MQLLMRPAKPDDIPTVLTICRHALPTHEVANFTHPYRHIHSSSYLSSMDSSPTKKISENISNCYNLVMEDGESGEVVAWAYWRRNVGEEYEAKVEKYRKVLNGDRGGDGSGVKVDEEELGNPAASAARLMLMARCAAGDTVRYFSNPHWYLSQLFVPPSQKRKGLGTLLVLWGMRRASLEGLPCFLTASDEGERLYTRLGFEEVGRRSWPKLEDMNEEDRRKEEEFFGKEMLVEQFNIVPPLVMRWDDYSVLKRYKDRLEMVMA
ncbi:hypothetical protein ABW19_dt0209133 [Dactylella cylindrospora]|nr:hypothetical protein ABW19_dt0209133 [Dactylella cylindrospora]